jgi:SAM-dependent methyltransferase
MARRGHAHLSPAFVIDDSPKEGQKGGEADGWLGFWGSPHAIYVNARHHDLHYRILAEELRGYLPSPTAAVLDYGCGEALHADRLAAAAGRVMLCEAAPRVRARLAARFRDHLKITVQDVAALDSQGEGSLDLIALISVVQYLDRDQLDGLLTRFHSLLRPSGILVVGDVIPPHVSPLADAAALLRLAAANGFLTAAIIGLGRTALSNYSKLRATLGLSCYSQPEMLQKLAAAGFNAVRVFKNIGHNQARMTFVAWPRQARG